MNESKKLFTQLIGLDDNWKVADVVFEADRHCVLVDLQYVGKKVICPKCHEACNKADTAPEREWRHLDTMQFETRLRASVPRSSCKECGVKTIQIPWSKKSSRFTLLFESFAIEVMRVASSLNRAAMLLRINWSSAQQIMKRAVERGLDRRENQPIDYIGIDEKSFGKGQDYISMMVDLDRSRVIDVSKDRSEESCDQLFNQLTSDQKQGVLAITTDFWQAYRNSIRKNVPHAEIVYDRFHVSQYLGDAVDLVRRQENKSLRSQGNTALTGTRHLWLYNKDKLDRDCYHQLEKAQRNAIRTSRAWALKEMFRDFWAYRSEGWARKLFKKWYSWAIRSRLDPIKKVAVMLKKHLTGLLAYIRHRITNAKAEAFNSRIQSIKAAARGFRDFKNYRIRILFYCGKLDMLPHTSH